jgi:hypothetical protein
MISAKVRMSTPRVVKGIRAVRVLEWALELLGRLDDIANLIYRGYTVLLAALLEMLNATIVRLVREAPVTPGQDRRGSYEAGQRTESRAESGENTKHKRTFRRAGN